MYKTIFFYRQVARIQSLDEIPVEIKVFKPLNTIHIRGPSEAVAEVLPAIYAIFREVDEEKHTQMERDMISKEVFYVISHSSYVFILLVSEGMCVTCRCVA